MDIIVNKLNAKRQTPNALKGFTVVELLVVVAITAMIAAIVIASLNNFRERQVPKNSIGEIAGLLERARSLTLASKDETVYGVHLLTNGAYLFKGTIFSSSSVDNIFVPLDALVATRSTLVGGGSKIVFDRLTGKTSQYGTIDIYLVSSTTQKRTITVHQTGIIESK